MGEYIYNQAGHLALLANRTLDQVVNLEIPVADLIERECGTVLSGPDRMEIQNIRSKNGWQCLDGDEYFKRFHPGENQVDILMGVQVGCSVKVFVADCKIQMKGGASLLNLKNLPDVCKDIFDKYQAVKEFIEPIMPITQFHVIFNHSVAAVARNVWNRCRLGSNRDCMLLKCFKYECVTIAEFRKLINNAVRPVMT